MRSTAFYTIYALVGFAVWLVVGNLILLASVSAFYQFLQNLAFARQVTYAACFVPLGSLTALFQAALMAKGGREHSRWLMGGAPLVLGAVVGAVLAIAGPTVIVSQLGPVEATNNVLARFIVGTVLGVVAIFATTALAALLRSRLGMRGPLPGRRV